MASERQLLHPLNSWKPVHLSNGLTLTATAIDSTELELLERLQTSDTAKILSSSRVPLFSRLHLPPTSCALTRQELRVDEGRTAASWREPKGSRIQSNVTHFHTLAKVLKVKSRCSLKHGELFSPVQRRRSRFRIIKLSSQHRRLLFRFVPISLPAPFG